MIDVINNKGILKGITLDKETLLSYIQIKRVVNSNENFSDKDEKAERLVFLKEFKEYVNKSSSLSHKNILQFLDDSYFKYIGSSKQDDYRVMEILETQYHLNLADRNTEY